MRKIFWLGAIISLICILGACSLIGTSNPTTSVTVSSNYPDSVVYKIKLSTETYLCSSFTVSNTDVGVSLRLIEVYTLASDGKITWIGQEKIVSAVNIEKVPK
jgi:hypothetical protein